MPAYEYFKAQFLSKYGDYYTDMCVYTACELIDPRFVKQKSFPYTNAEVRSILAQAIVLKERFEDECMVNRRLDSMMDEFDKYRVLARELCPFKLSLDPLDNNEFEDKDGFKIGAFWTKVAAKLPKWKLFADRARLIQTSSASVERVFAALKRLFDRDQRSALEDKKYASVKKYFDKIIQ